MLMKMNPMKKATSALLTLVLALTCPGTLPVGAETENRAPTEAYYAHEQASLPHWVDGNPDAAAAFAADCVERGIGTVSMRDEFETIYGEDMVPWMEAQDDAA